MVYGTLTGMEEVFLVSDENVLIDYYKSNPKLLRILCSEYNVIIPQVIIEELTDECHPCRLSSGQLKNVPQNQSGVR